MTLVIRSVKGTNLTPTEVDDNFKHVGVVQTSTSNTILFDTFAGYRHGTWGTPITGAIVLDVTDAVEGSVGSMLWSGSINPTITGGTVQSLSGNITASGTYTIYFHYINGRFNVNIFNVSGTGGDTTAPLYVSSDVGDIDDVTLIITYDETLDSGSVPAVGDFVVNDGAINAVTSVSISGTDISLSLTNAIANGDTVVVSYTKGTNPIQDATANESVNLVTEAVTNNVAGASFTPLTVTVEAANPPIESPTNVWTGGAGAPTLGSQGWDTTGFTGDFEFKIDWDVNTSIGIGVDVASGEVAFGASDYLMYEIGSGFVVKQNNAAQTQDNPPTFTYTAGDILKFQRTGTNLFIYYNAFLIHTFASATGTLFPTIYMNASAALSNPERIG